MLLICGKPVWERHSQVFPLHYTTGIDHSFSLLIAYADSLQVCEGLRNTDFSFLVHFVFNSESYYQKIQSFRIGLVPSFLDNRISSV